MAKTWKWLLAVLAVLALVAGACGSDDEDDDGGSTETTEASGETTDDGDDETETTEAADEAADGDDEMAAECETVDEVSLQLQWVAQAQFAGYFAAVDEGIYEAHCLDVTIEEGAVDIVPQVQLATGAVDFALAWVPKALQSNEDPEIDIVNVAQIFQRSGTLQVSFADQGITAPADLEGKQVGNWGFGNELELVAGLLNEGFEEGSDFDFVQQEFNMDALLSGEIDAAQAMTYNEYAQVLEAENPETGELYQESDFNVIDWNNEGTAMLQDAIWADAARLAEDAAYADAATRLIAASIEGWIWCRDNGPDCVDVVLANGTTLGRSHQEWQLNEINKLIWPSEAGVGVMDQALWDQTVETSLAAGFITAEPEDGAFTTEYVEAALAMVDGDTVGADFEPVEVELLPGGE